jgi:hypothetical protein
MSQSFSHNLADANFRGCQVGVAPTKGGIKSSGVIMAAGVWQGSYKRLRIRVRIEAHGQWSRLSGFMSMNRNSYAESWYIQLGLMMNPNCQLEPSGTGPNSITKMVRKEN